MNRQLFLLKAQEGSALVVALMILIILTLMGISAISTTDIELRIAANERNYKLAFFHADTGIYATPKVISACVDDLTQMGLSSITYLDSGTSDFYKEIMGMKAYDSAKDIQYNFDNSSIEVDIKYEGAKPNAGGAIEFASGAQGIGNSLAGGGYSKIFELDSTGEGPTSAVANISAVYRKVPGMPGGL